MVRDQTRWIVVSFDDGSPPTNPHTDVKNSNLVFHGTSMLSLVTGKGLGVSKRVKLVVVRLPSRRVPRVPLPPPGDTPDKWDPYTPESWIKALGMILDDMGEGHRNVANSVVLLATYWPPGEVAGGFRDRSFRQLSELSRRGAVLVTGSGQCSSLHKPRKV